jgi:hypothetical protein
MQNAIDGTGRDQNPAVLAEHWPAATEINSSRIAFLSGAARLRAGVFSLPPQLSLAARRLVSRLSGRFF